MKLFYISTVVMSFAISSVFASSSLSGGVSGSGRLMSAIPREHKSLQISTSMTQVAGDAMGLRDANGAKLSGGDAMKSDYVTSLSYGFLPFLEASLSVPYRIDQDYAGTMYDGAGDVRASVKFNYPPYPHKKGYDLSYLLQLDLPTASSEQAGGFNRHAWNNTIYYRKVADGGLGTVRDSLTPSRKPFGAHGPVFIMRLLNTVNLGAIDGMFPLLIHLNWGLALSDNVSENAFLLAGGLEMTPTPYLSIFWGFDGEVDVSRSSKSIPIFDYPYRSSAGLTGHIPKIGLDITVGSDFRINPTDNAFYHVAPKASGQIETYDRVSELGFFGELSVSFSFLPKDGDGDGIVDKKDRCPTEAEDQDGFEDGDGCPELDNDLDGIPDLKDKCPDKKEDMDQFEDEDGCPDLDNDKDGISDAKDKCPLEAEDKDKFEDQDGCPDLDNDKDGILDAKDKCPLQAEDRDGYQDQDGCPDLDNDKDGIPDAVDKCPDKAETINGVQDGDGCPDKA